MPAQHDPYKVYRYDGHGHSLFSDGSDTPGAIVSAALKKNIQIIGLSDHDTVAGLPAFIDACHQANKEGVHVLPIPSVEVSTTEGDLLVALPYPTSARAFIKTFPQWIIPANPIQVIEESILRYHALCVFLHPETQFLNGFTQRSIQEILKKVPRVLHAHIGIETENWMTQIFFWNRHRVEKHLHHINKEWGLAEFSFSDFHRARHVGNHTTEMSMLDLTPTSFVDAFRMRRTRPTPAPHTIKHLLSAGMTSLQADLLAPYES